MNTSQATASRPLLGASFFDIRCWRALRSIAAKEVRRFLRIWVQTVIPPIMTTVLYFLIFGGILGNNIGHIGNLPYAKFIIPGLVLTAVITNSSSNVSTSLFSAKIYGNIQELLVAPVPHWVIVAGYMSGGMARGVLLGILTSLVARFFVAFTLHAMLGGLLVLTLTSALFALLGFMNALYAKTYDEISLFPNFILTPLSYLSGSFYAKSMLPIFWQKCFDWNPIAYIVDAMRYSFFGISEFSLLRTVFFLSCGNITLYFLSCLLLRKHSGITE